MPLFSEFFTQHEQSDLTILGLGRLDGPKRIERVGGIETLGSAGHGNPFSFGTPAGVTGQGKRYRFGTMWFAWGDIGTLFAGIASSEQ